MGTSRSKSYHNQWVQQSENDSAKFESIYNESWIAARAVNIPASDMTREWRSINHDQMIVIQSEEQKLKVQSLVTEALIWADVFGGSVIIPIIQGADLTSPVNFESIKVGDVERLLVLDRHYISGSGTLNHDIMSSNFMLPDSYRIANSNQVIDQSWIIRFNGALLSNRARIANQGWGGSKIKRIHDEVTNLSASFAGIADLMSEANVDIVKFEGLTGQISSDQEKHILKRAELFAQGKGNVNTGVLDKEDEYVRNTLSLSGVSQVLDQEMAMCAGACGMPVTKLFGVSAGGLNATGENDLKNYYDNIRADQTLRLTHSLNQLDQFLVRSAIGSYPDDYSFSWNTLFQVDPLESAQSNDLQASTDQKYFEMGVIDRSQIAKELQSREQYQFGESQIEEMENEELGDDLELS